MAITNSPMKYSATALPILTASSNVAVTTMYLCNKSPSMLTCNIFLLPSGSTDYANTIVYTNLRIAGGDTYILENERILLNAGDSIQGNVGVDNLTDNLLIATVSFTNI